MNRTDRAVASRFCAVCTKPLPEGRRVVKRALGRGGALVAVCQECDPGHPGEKKRLPPAVNSTRGYSGGTGPALRDAELTAALRSKQGEAGYAKDSGLARAARRYLPPKLTQEERDIAEVVHEGQRRRRTGAAQYSSLRSSRQRTVLK